MRGREIHQPEIAERGLATEQDRRAVEEEAVDEVGVEKRRGGVCATFDEEVSRITRGVRHLRLAVADR